MGVLKNFEELMGKHLYQSLFLTKLQAGFFENSGFLIPVISRTAIRGFLKKKVFLKISQNSQESTRAKDFFSVKLQASDLRFY